MHRGPGLLCSAQYNLAFCFPYTLQGRQCEMVFTSVAGHLLELDFPPSHRTWLSCPPLDLYTAPIIKTVSEVPSFATTAATSVCCLSHLDL